MSIKKTNTEEWWNEKYGFFGDFYITGDNTLEGHLAKNHLTIEQRTKREIFGLLNLLAPKPNSTILDIPCGYGRHSIELAKLGYQVTGSDINQIHLARANQLSKRLDLDIAFNLENMIEIDYDQKFDVLINMFYSFGFFETEEENVKVLTNFYNALKKGGKFVFHTDVNVPRILAGAYKEDETRTIVSGGELRIIDRYDKTTKRINGSWIITDSQGNVIKKDYSVRVYEKNEFIKLCHDVGFKTCVAFKDWDGNPYSLDGEEMIIVAEK